MKYNGQTCRLTGRFGNYTVWQCGHQYGLASADVWIEEPRFFEITELEPGELYCRGAVDSVDFDYLSGRITGMSSYSDETKDQADDEGYVRTCRDGRFGLSAPDGRIILECLFDEVFKWPEWDVVYTRIGSCAGYFNTSGQRILTKVRVIDGATDRLEPYYIDEPQTNIIQTIDYTSAPSGDDYALFRGHKAGLARRTLSEHMDWLDRLSNIERFRLRGDNSLMADDCYIFEAFIVETGDNSPDAVIDCLAQLKDRQVFCASWLWMYTLLMPADTPRETIETWKRVLKMLKVLTPGNYVHDISIGTSPSVKGLQLIATRYFCDHFPSEEEFRISGVGRSTDLAGLEAFFKTVSPSDMEEALENAVSNTLAWQGSAWDEKVVSLDWLIGRGAKFSHNIWHEVISSYHPLDFREIEWLLDNGADVNLIFRGKTPLDLADKLFPDNVNLRDLLLGHGAMTVDEIIAEESARHNLSRLSELKEL